MHPLPCAALPGLLALMLVGSRALAQQPPSNQHTTMEKNSPLFATNTGSVTVIYNELNGQEAFDARKELAKRNIPWDTESFGKALVQGDAVAVKLFLKSKIDIYGECRGTYAVAKFISDTKHLKNFEHIFQLLLQHGLNVDHKLEERLSPGMTTLAEHAVAAEHSRAFRLLWSNSRKKDVARIRQTIEQKIAALQIARHPERGPKAPSGEVGGKALLQMLLELDRNNRFVLRGHKVHAGPDGWALVLETNSVVAQVLYEINTERKTVQNTGRLPIQLEDFKKPRTPVHIEARDVHGRTLQETLFIDREEIQ